MSADRQERPGPFPHRLVWRGWKTVAGLVFAAVLFVAVQSENRYFLGVMITLLGVGSLIWALGRDHDRIREEARYTRGPGWWIGWLASKLPTPPETPWSYSRFVFVELIGNLAELMVRYKHGERTNGFQVKTIAWDAVAPAIARSGAETLGTVHSAYPTPAMLASYVNARYKPVSDTEIALPDDEQERRRKEFAALSIEQMGSSMRACGRLAGFSDEEAQAKLHAAVGEPTR